MADNDVRLLAATRQVDEAIVAGMRHAQFPRGPVNAVLFEDLRRGTNAIKRETSEIVFSDTYLAALREPRINPDALFRTWIHESLHARHPYTGREERTAEYVPYPGYEEGLVDGLTAYLLRTLTNTSVTAEYAEYIAAYERLARHLGIESIALWRDLWPHPFGAVRTHFATVVTRFWYTTRRSVVDPTRILRAADHLFAAVPRHPPYSDADMDAIWKEALDARS